MDLPQIHVIGPESAQRCLQVAHEGAAGVVDDTLAVALHEPGLGGDDQVVTHEVTGDEFSDGRLGGTVAIGGGGVDQISTGLDVGVHEIAHLRR